MNNQTPQRVLVIADTADAHRIGSLVQEHGARAITVTSLKSAVSELIKGQLYPDSVIIDPSGRHIDEADKVWGPLADYYRILRAHAGSDNIGNMIIELFRLEFISSRLKGKTTPHSIPILAVAHGKRNINNREMEEKAEGIDGIEVKTLDDYTDMNESDMVQEFLTGIKQS